MPRPPPARSGRRRQVITRCTRRPPAALSRGQRASFASFHAARARVCVANETDFEFSFFMSLDMIFYCSGKNTLVELNICAISAYSPSFSKILRALPRNSPSFSEFSPRSKSILRVSPKFPPVLRNSPSFSEFAPIKSWQDRLTGAG